MKPFVVFSADNEPGERILGSQRTGSHACYLIHGILAAGEGGRELRPGTGHEELVLALQGDLFLTGAFTGTLRQGEAVHLKGEDRITAENRGAGPAVYVIAGGHSGHDHHR